jgi:catechol 2,3-dioxygenase-like lactoylglutathione lyase family enzyme
MDSVVPKIRLSRSTNNLEKLINFYCNGLGFEVLDRYEAQVGWDGVICGHKDWPYQFEFSQKRGEDEVPRAPTPNHFIVLPFRSTKSGRRRSGSFSMPASSR